MLESPYEFISVKRYARNNGCPMRPTPRSDRAKLKYKALDGAWSEEILRSEMAITMFPNVAVNESRTLRTEFPMYDTNRTWDNFRAVEELLCSVML